MEARVGVDNSPNPPLPVTRTCQFNAETNKFFDLQAFPPENRLDAYKQYIEDLKAGKYISRPCPSVSEKRTELEVKDSPATAI